MTGKPSTNRRLGWVIALTSTAYFMVVLDALVVMTALPRMQRDLHVGVSSLQWTVNAYGIAFAAGIITAAALGDRFGRRLVFNSGLALFTVASAACALAPNVDELIAARAVQGLGAAAVLPLSLTILTTAFPPQKRGTIVGSLRRPGGSRRCARADRWGRDHPRDRLALDLLGQRPDRTRDGAPRAAPPGREPRRLGADGHGGGVARHRGRGRARLGAHSRQRRRLG